MSCTVELSKWCYYSTTLRWHLTSVGVGLQRTLFSAELDLPLTLLKLPIFIWFAQHKVHLVKTVLHDNGAITYINMKYLDTVLQELNWLNSPCACMSVGLKEVCRNTNCCVLKIGIDVCMEAMERSRLDPKVDSDLKLWGKIWVSETSD